MLVVSGDFLIHAFWLLNQPQPNEINHRSAISRAYYSLYHETLSFLKEKYKTELIEKIIGFTLSKRGSTFYDANNHEKRINEFDADYIMSLGVSFHQLIPSVLRSINSNYAWEFKQHRKKRNCADYSIGKIISQQYAEHEVKAISDLITAIKSS